jgi:hypothetical protein
MESLLLKKNVTTKELRSVRAYLKNRLDKSHAKLCFRRLHYLVEYIDNMLLTRKSLRMAP